MLVPLDARTQAATSVGSSVNPAVVGQPVTFTATVSAAPPATGTPTGTVDFYDGTTKLGSGPLNQQNPNQATFTTASLAVGSHTFTAKYAGDPTFAGSSSSPLTQAVTYKVCTLYDQTQAVNAGSVIPIKLDLCTATGNGVSAPSIVVHAMGVTQASTNAPGVLSSPGNANSDSDFRFDGTLGLGGGYIFNLKTAGLTTGMYNLNFTAGADPTTHTVQFEVR